jgi:phosphoribosylformylglycinamidine (FGAM) synthase PurS component
MDYYNRYILELIVDALQTVNSGGVARIDVHTEDDRDMCVEILSALYFFNPNIERISVKFHRIH